ncbi:MAG: dethiobiotin synthase [Alphaproteobacteria bacterium]
MISNNSETYLILGIGTDIGKTFVIEKLLQKYPQAKAIKPIATGFSVEDFTSDTMKILKALQNNNYDFEREKNHFKITLAQENYFQLISPFVFAKPTSPNLVADISYSKLLDFCFSQINFAKKNNFNLFIESAGGVMTPINNQKTFLDLAKDLKVKIILVSSNYLGAISHTLTAIESLIKNNQTIDFLIINDELYNHQKITNTHHNNCLTPQANLKINSNQNPLINSFNNYPNLTFEEISSSIKNFYNDLQIISLKSNNFLI